MLHPVSRSGKMLVKIAVGEVLGWVPLVFEEGVDEICVIEVVKRRS